MSNAPTTSNETDAVWLSVADFAKAHNRSNRTVKRWIEEGVVESKKEGANRFVRPKQEGHTRDTTSDTSGTRPEGHTAPEVTQPPKVTLEGVTQEERKGDTEGTRAVSLATEREKELRGEIMFLRGLVEQHQRSEAELRAALREALKMSARQITAGDAATSPESPAIATPAAQPTNTAPGASDGHQAAQSATVTPIRRGNALAMIRDGLRGLIGR